MSFDRFLDKCWTDHVTDAAAVLARLPEGLGIVQSNEELASLSQLATHVAGEHLGKWHEGCEFLLRLTRHSTFVAGSPSGNAVHRGLAILTYCAGKHTESAKWEAAARTGGGVPEASDKIRVLSGAAAALAGQSRSEEAANAFDEALKLAAYGPTKSDPATRALAATGNNIATELAERRARTPRETELMILAATTARRYWEIAGTWLEVERAEYRLALTMLAAGDPAAGLRHAETCHHMCEDNDAVPYERFYAQEALARAYKATGNFVFAKIARDTAAALLPRMKDELRPDCQDVLNRLDGAMLRG